MGFLGGGHLLGYVQYGFSIESREGLVSYSELSSTLCDLLVSYPDPTDVSVIA